MKNTRYLRHLAGLLLTAALLSGLGSCGTTRAHIGIEHEVAYDWNGGFFEDGGHGHHKKPKPPKHKKPKPPKHNGKHKHHHHD